MCPCGFRVLLPAEPVIGQRGINSARANNIDSDSVSGEVEGHSFAHGDDAARGGGVGNRIGLPDESHHAADIDDHTPGFAEMSYGVLHAEEDTAQVRVQDILPFFF